MTDTEATRWHRLLAAIVVGIFGYAAGYVNGFGRGQEEAVQTTTGTVSLEPLPEQPFPGWVEPVGDFLTLVVLLLIIWAALWMAAYGPRP